MSKSLVYHGSLLSLLSPSVVHTGLVAEDHVAYSYGLWVSPVSDDHLNPVHVKVMALAHLNSVYVKVRASVHPNPVYVNVRAFDPCLNPVCKGFSLYVVCLCFPLFFAILSLLFLN